MNIDTIKSVYFIGAGGIGMSALVRYFLSLGKEVAGYDRTSSELTERLNAEGASIHYEDNTGLIPTSFRDKSHTLVVYTPAIPERHNELNWFRTQGFEIQKRAQVLGTITRSRKGLCVAGTHGKTTTSSMAAHLIYNSHIGTTAFLGGISQNYGTNLLTSDKSDYVVIEADEYDRSFHQLSPYITAITSADPDHLDIYGTPEAYRESFEHYTSLIQPGGALIVHEGLDLTPRVQQGVSILTYSREKGDYHAANIRIGGGEIVFDFVHPDGVIRDINLGVPLSVNIDNGIAAMAMALLVGVTEEQLRSGMTTFRGVERRFDFKLKSETKVYLSDYAHHPAEISQSARSIRELYAGHKVTAIFQPHLYSRTQDFYREFAHSLSLFDEVILTDIYPAREEPIPGVTSKLIYDNLRPDMEKMLIDKNQVLATIEAKRNDIEVLVTLGAGDIEDLAADITEILKC